MTVIAQVLNGGNDQVETPSMLSMSAQQLIKVEPFTQSAAFTEKSDDTYVLLVDGVESSNYNAAFDWSRHLATSDVPLDRPSHDKFVFTLQLAVL